VRYWLGHERGGRGNTPRKIEKKKNVEGGRSSLKGLSRKKKSKIQPQNPIGKMERLGGQEEKKVKNVDGDCLFY